MKKILYVVAFGFFGLLIATLIHAGIELVALELIFGNPNSNTTWWWQEWDLIHAVGGTGLWVAGLVVGIALGFCWWPQYGSKPGFYHWQKRGK